MAGEVIGKAINCDLERSEDDTDDVVVHFTNGGSDVDTTGWTGLLSVGSDKDNLITGGPQPTYPATGSGTDGLLTVDMALFDIPIGSHKYDIRYTDPAGDSPSRVAARGALKVVARIN